MINQYIDKKFVDAHLTTLGLDFVQQKYSTRHDGTEVPIKIWDTAGQERFKTLTQSFYRKADGVIICFDVTDHHTFENVRNWVESINKHASTSAARVLVGNKIDLPEDRKVTKQEAEDLASQYGINFHETSAKADIGLKETFEDIFEQSYKNKFITNGEAPDQQARNNSVKINKNNQKPPKRKCCGGN